MTKLAARAIAKATRAYKIAVAHRELSAIEAEVARRKRAAAMQRGQQFGNLLAFSLPAEKEPTCH